MSEPTRYGCRTPYAASLALQSMAYRAMGHAGMDEDAPLDVIPRSLLKPEPVISDAMRLIGREICSDTRRYDEREMRRAFNRRED